MAVEKKAQLYEVKASQIRVEIWKYKGKIMAI